MKRSGLTLISLLIAVALFLTLSGTVAVTFERRMRPRRDAEALKIWIEQAINRSQRWQRIVYIDFYPGFTPCRARCSDLDDNCGRIFRAARGVKWKIYRSARNIRIIPHGRIVSPAFRLTVTDADGGNGVKLIVSLRGRIRME